MKTLDDWAAELGCTRAEALDYVRRLMETITVDASHPVLQRLRDTPRPLLRGFRR